MSVRFVSPAKSFHESCPLGNGRLGATDFGGVGRQRIVLNESSLWSGGPYDGNKYDAFQCLPEVREKLFAGDISGAGSGRLSLLASPATRGYDKKHSPPDV